MNKKVDIVFVNPSGYPGNGFPFGIAILSAILKKDNFNVHITDASSYFGHS